MTQFPSQMSVFHQSEAGQVGGLSNVWQPADLSLTRPANSTPYAANQAIGSSTTALFKFSKFFRTNGSSALLSGLRLTASVSGIAATNMGNIRAHLFNAVPNGAIGTGGTALVDQGTFQTLAVDDALKLGVVDFSSWGAIGTGSTLIESYGSPAISPLPLIAAQGAIDLYLILVATAAFTPASGQVILPYASAVLD